MRYESQKTAKGNVGASYVGQAEADAQAVAMDAANCTDCRYCTNCTGCTDCTDCTNCTGCTDCTDCTNCTNCRYCTDCTDCTGVLRWSGPAAGRLLALNGLRWSVATDGIHLQIGCQQHPVARWAELSDAQIERMDGEALAFWREHKGLVLSLAAAWAARNEEKQHD